MKILVGLSGGVDSSLSAALLKEQGHEVVGVYLKAWDEALAPDMKSECPWKQDVADARQVAAFLGIPFTVIDVRKAYKKKVVDVLESEYAAGRTPNPDILCNREMKFGILKEVAKELGYDRIATGHYARIHETHNMEHETNSNVPILKSQKTNNLSPITYHLLRGVDPIKDQTYFLWQLTDDDLSCTLFPIGDLPKSQVRIEAEKRNLPVAKKRDSQGICFLGDLNLRSYLHSRLGTHRGKVIDADGKVVGEHEGAALYTLGQREGLGIFGGSGKVYFVVKKDIERNVIVVDDKPPVSDTLTAVNLNWLEEPPKASEVFEARIRHGQEPQPCHVSRIMDHGSKTIEIQFDQSQTAIAPGQSVVFSKGEVVLGGGIIA